MSTRRSEVSADTQMDKVTRKPTKSSLWRDWSYQPKRNRAGVCRQVGLKVVLIRKQ